MQLLRDKSIIPKGRVPTALNTTPHHVNQMEALDVIRFEETPTGRKYTSFACIEAAAEWLRTRVAV
jgi:hypothetical protein